MGHYPDLINHRANLRGPLRRQSLWLRQSEDVNGAGWSLVWLILVAFYILQWKWESGCLVISNRRFLSHEGD
jgi:hypothetical protein